MATAEFLEIASFASAAEADQLRSILEEHGISAFVDGANASTTLSHVGSALGGVRVLVRAADAQRAMDVIASLEDESDLSAEAWFCGACQEEVDGGFQVCWSCGKDRSEVEQPFPESSHEEQLATAQELYSTPHVETDGDAGYDRSNPYVSPQSPPEMTTDEPPLEINPEAEAMLLRAWRASIIGLIFLPVIAQLYSMWLLIHASILATDFSPEGRTRFYLALAVNVFAGCLYAMIFGRMFG